MWQVVGHNRVVSLFQRGLAHHNLSHAYLLVGPPHVGKMTLAVGLAQALNCDSAEPPCCRCVSCQKIAAGKHADVQVIGMEAGSTEISIDRIRQMQTSASLPPFEGKYKVFVIDGGEFLSIEAANCLLKTLEEPVGKVVFILLTADTQLLPATVVSRCQRLELTPLGAADIESALKGRGIDSQKSNLLARLSHGCPGWAIAAATDDSLLEQRAERLDRLFEVLDGDYEVRFTYASELSAEFSRSRESVQGVLDLWLDWWRDLLLVKAGTSGMITNVDFEAQLMERAKVYNLSQVRDAIRNILTASDQLRRNANSRLVLEVLMLNIPRKEERGEAKLTAQLVNG